jgi:hypothetical protein
MSRYLPFGCILSLALSTIVNGNAASTLKLTCSGKLTNTSTDGVTLGDCDLNFIAVKQMDEIEDTCGIPGTVDPPAENHVEYEQLFHLIQVLPQIIGSYTKLLKCGR